MQISLLNRKTRLRFYSSLNTTEQKWNDEGKKGKDTMHLQRTIFLRIWIRICRQNFCLVLESMNHAIVCLYTLYSIWGARSVTAIKTHYLHVFHVLSRPSVCQVFFQINSISKVYNTAKTGSQHLHESQI